MSAEVEALIRRSLPELLVSEYGETGPEWTELGSVRRIAKALAAEIDEVLA